MILQEEERVISCTAISLGCEDKEAANTGTPIKLYMYFLLIIRVCFFPNLFFCRQVFLVKLFPCHSAATPVSKMNPLTQTADT